MTPFRYLIWIAWDEISLNLAQQETRSCILHSAASRLWRQSRCKQGQQGQSGGRCIPQGPGPPPNCLPGSCWTAACPAPGLSPPHLPAHAPRGRPPCFISRGRRGRPTSSTSLCEALGGRLRGHLRQGSDVGPHPPAPGWQPSTNTGHARVMAAGATVAAAAAARTELQTGRHASRNSASHTRVCHRAAAE